jgi:hypothetical protein
MGRPHVERREVGPHHRAVWRPACLGRRPAHPRLLGPGHHPPSPRTSRWLRCWMSARLRGRERLLAVAMGYGVIGSPTGSGPVSLGSSPGTPAEAGLSAHWPLANFAGGPQCFPGGTPPGPPGAGLFAHWPLANFAGGPQCFPGGRPPDPPAWPTLGWWAGVRRPGPVVSGPPPPRGLPRGPVPRRWLGSPARFGPCLAPRVGFSRAARSPGGGWGRPARFGPCLAPRVGCSRAARSPGGGWGRLTRFCARLGPCAGRSRTVCPARLASPGDAPSVGLPGHWPRSSHESWRSHMARRDYGERFQSYGRVCF